MSCRLLNEKVGFSSERSGRAKFSYFLTIILTFLTNMCHIGTDYCLKIGHSLDMRASVASERKFSDILPQDTHFD